MAKLAEHGAATMRNDRLGAIVLVLAAVTLFSCLDTVAKYLVTYSGLPVGQVVWLRFVSQFLIMLVFVPALGIMSAPSMFATSQLKLQIIRSVFMALCTVFNFLALKLLQLDQAIAILFLAPLLVALLAGPVLGEWVGARRLGAIFIGFIGILVVVRPGFVEMGWGVVFSFLAMASLAVFILMTRQLARGDPAIVTLFYSLFAAVVIGAPYTLMYGGWPSGHVTWTLLAITGVFGGLGHYLFILAHIRAPAGHLAPFLYVQIIPTVILGFVVFGDLPDYWTVIGAAIVVGSGVYVFHRERVKQAD